MVQKTSRTSEQDGVLRAVDELSDQLVGTLRAMVRIPTINPPGECYEQFCQYYENLLAELGYNTETVRVPDSRLGELAPLGDGAGRPSVLGHLDGPDGPGKRIHLNGHYDVVRVSSGWTHDPFAGTQVDNRIYGRGTADQKSGLAAAVIAVEALRGAEVPWRGRITHSAVPDEETTGVHNAGTGYLVETGHITTSNTDAVVITEPFSPSGVGIGHKGAIWGEITITGKSAHGSSPQLGANAVEAAARALARVEEHLQPKLAHRVTSYDVTPAGSTSATLSFDTVRGGEATNIVPDRCTVTFNRRLVPGESLHEAREELLAYFASACEDDPDLHLHYHENYSTEPVLVSEDQPIATSAKDAVRALDLHPRTLISAGSDDQRFIARDAGITNCIVYGPGRTGLSHTTDEHIDIDDLIAGTKGLALILLDQLQ
ncbi:acetylornithine deacetylase/succinyl-diaminopimelate desuccinylase family protein [Salinifilum aidingensis]